MTVAHKTGKTVDSTDSYRPISILPTIEEVFQRLTIT